jgi:hypothetical protein
MCLTVDSQLDFFFFLFSPSLVWPLWRSQPPWTYRAPFFLLLLLFGVRSQPHPLPLPPSLFLGFYCVVTATLENHNNPGSERVKKKSPIARVSGHGCTWIRNSFIFVRFSPYQTESYRANCTEKGLSRCCPRMNTNDKRCHRLR